MFLNMGNNDIGKTLSGDDLPSEQQLIRWLLDRLRASLPTTWGLRAEFDISARAARNAGMRPDLLVVISAPTGESATLAIEVKRNIEPRDVYPLIHRLKTNTLNTERAGTHAISLLVAAPFIGLRARDSLLSAGINYLDATDNLYLRLDRPALFIERQGASSNPWLKGRDLRTLKGPAAGRVVRALCDFSPPYGVRELAQRATTPAGTVTKILALLDREALVTRAARGKYAGKILSVDWRRLLQRWTQDYSFETSNITRRYLEPRGLDALLAKLKATSMSYAITGSFASVSVAPIVQPRLMALYVEDAERAATTFGLRPAERGANVLLAQPFDMVVFARPTVRDELTYAAYTQVVADLLTSHGRGPQEGAALLKWMEEHEDVWRR